MLINKENNLWLANTTENILIHYTEHSIVWKEYEILPLPVRDNIWSSNNATDTKRFCKAPPFLHHKIKQRHLSGINHLITPTSWISNSFFKSTSLSCVCAYMWSESERGDLYLLSCGMPYSISLLLRRGGGWGERQRDEDMRYNIFSYLL